MGIVKQYALSDKEREDLITLMKNAGITGEDFRHERVAMVYQTGPVVIIPTTERGARHALKKHVERGNITQEMADYSLDYPHDFIIVMARDASGEEDPIAYGTEDDWKFIEEALGY
jgi:hypothetical protein